MVAINQKSYRTIWKKERVPKWLIDYILFLPIIYMVTTEPIVDPFMVMIAISGFFSVAVLVSSLLTIRKKKLKKVDIVENNI